MRSATKETPGSSKNYAEARERSDEIQQLILVTENLMSGYLVFLKKKVQNQ